MLTSMNGYAIGVVAITFSLRTLEDLLLPREELVLGERGPPEHRLGHDQADAFVRQPLTGDVASLAIPVGRIRRIRPGRPVRVVEDGRGDDPADDEGVARVGEGSAGAAKGWLEPVADLFALHQQIREGEAGVPNQERYPTGIARGDGGGAATWL